MEMRFDPQTGEPIQNNPTPEAPRFDPQTGEPIQSDPTPRFDPKTGMPLMGGNDGTDRPKSPKKKGKGGLIAGIVAVVAVVAIVFGIFKSGIFASPETKVRNAVVKTLENGGYVTDSLKNLSELLSDEATITFNVEYDGEEASGTFAYEEGKRYQLSAAVDISDIPEVEGVLDIDDKGVQVSVPSISDKLYVYRYDDHDGFLDDEAGEYLEQFDEMMKLLVDSSEQKDQEKEIRQAYEDFIDELEFEKVDKEEFEVDGKDRKCTGYEVTVTSDDMTGLFDDLGDIMDETYGDEIFSIAGYYSNPFSEMSYEFEDMPDITMTFYLYKGELACILLESDDMDEEIEIAFLGGDYRTQNMEFRVDGEEYITIEGSQDKNEETIEVITEGYTILELTYDKKSGEFSLEVDGADTIEGTFLCTKKEMTLTIDNMDELIGTDVEFAVEATSKASYQKLDGDEFDIGNASEDDLIDEIDEIAEELDISF